MSRAAYHRAWYHANLESRREASRIKARRRRWVRGVVDVLCEAVEEARNVKPPFGGLTRAGGWPYSRIACRGDVMMGEGESPVNHPPPSSGYLVGETTRRTSLNPHRGGQPVGARRQSGSANVTGKPEK